MSVITARFDATHFNWLKDGLTLSKRQTYDADTLSGVCNRAAHPRNTWLAYSGISFNASSLERQEGTVQAAANLLLLFHKERILLLSGIGYQFTVLWSNLFFIKNLLYEKNKTS